MEKIQRNSNRVEYFETEQEIEQRLLQQNLKQSQAEQDEYLIDLEYRMSLKEMGL